MNPHRPDEVLAGLTDAQTTWTAYAQALPLETFFQAPSPGRWAPITHLRHLTLTHRRVTQGLSTPRPVLRVMFGTPGPARRYAELVSAYQAALAAGGTAPDRYVPALDRTVAEPVRDEALAAYATGAAALRGALARWSESDLDAHALPHDLLGRLSVREVALFTLYHDHHHLRGVRTALETP